MPQANFIKIESEPNFDPSNTGRINRLATPIGVGPPRRFYITLRTFP